MDIQLKILQSLQNMRSPLLNVLFLMFTISTEVPIIIGFTAIMYWCINKKYGQRILFVLVGNITINIGIKEFVKAPRPIGTPGLESLRKSTATGYSFPSGHTQTGTTFWVSLMYLLRKSWFYILGTIMILGIGISRLYLAVHWPIDVICGWIFGLIFTILLLNIFDNVDKTKEYYKLLLFLLLFIVVVFFLNSVEYIKMIGLLTGFILGYIVEDKYVKFSTDNKLKKINFGSKKRRFNKDSRLMINIYRLVCGLVTLGLIYIGLKYVKEILIINGIIENTEIINMMIDYFRYVIVVFYAVAGAPALFKKLDLN